MNTPDGNSVGICKAEKMVYITTRGMDICDGHIMEQASPYLKALTSFFGIKEFEMISAYGMDINTLSETEKRIEEAKQSKKLWKLRRQLLIVKGITNEKYRH